MPQTGSGFSCFSSAPTKHSILDIMLTKLHAFCFFRGNIDFVKKSVKVHVFYA